MSEEAINNLNKWLNSLPLEIRTLGDSLYSLAAAERESGKTIYPAQENIFKALILTPPESVKVVIVGQDPYYNPGQANGLAFSVNKGVSLPPSLKNIFKELNSDLGGTTPSSGDLTIWAKQGVLLLNTILTVEEGKPNSHSKRGWQAFVREVLKICVELPQPIVFILWGAQARAFIEPLFLSGNTSKLLLYSSHPSPLGARKASAAVPAFIGSCPFSKTNNWLANRGIKPVNWMLD